MTGFGKNLHNAVGQSIISGDAEIIISYHGDRGIQFAPEELPAAGTATHDIGIDPSDDSQIIRGISYIHVSDISACHSILNVARDPKKYGSITPDPAVNLAIAIEPLIGNWPVIGALRPS
ncbi:MAG: hypothetical protein VX205_00245 [Pseudomonadota bacterium]|nr:hypothetical protein [Pseudomonadota bacterium]